MTGHGYDAYLAAFNARDYDAMLEFFGPDPDIRSAGYSLRGRDADRLFPLKAGQVMVPQFIHYHLEQGKFVRAICRVVDSVARVRR